jgi:hypothetical protein
MTRTVPPFGFWLGVELRAEVVSTVTTVHNRKLRHLGQLILLRRDHSAIIRVQEQETGVFL